jgi:hypothetical protein
MIFIKKVMQSIEKQWGIFENFLLYPTKLVEFEKFLKNYRGLPISQGHVTFARGEAAEKAAVDLTNFFINIFSIEGLAEFSSIEIDIILEDIEKNINLSLYYWFGLNDRNFQFRTWIHFFNLEGFKTVFLTKEGKNYCVTLSENGISFAHTSNEDLPKIHPISKVLIKDLEALSVLQPNSNLNISQQLTKERFVFARLRTIQREICLLIDEWEYQNSILAVEYSNSMRMLQTHHTESIKLAHEKILLKMDIKRNFYAVFCLEALCDFQSWTNLIANNFSNADILAEIDALSGLILSALQKFFLPASISRLVYKKEVIELFNKFFKLRLNYCPEDYSSSLVLQATESALGQKFNSELFSILNMKPYEWKFCFDPSAGVKAFSWAYNRIHHVTLCVIMGICYFKKSYSNNLDEFQFSDLVTSFQTQDSFLSFLKKDPLYNLELETSGDIFFELKNTLNEFMQSHLKNTKNIEEDVKIIQSYLDYLIHKEETK